MKPLELMALEGRIERISTLFTLIVLALVALTASSIALLGRFGFPQQGPGLAIAFLPKAAHDWDVIKNIYSQEAADNYAVTLINVFIMSSIISFTSYLFYTVTLLKHAGQVLIEREFWRGIQINPSATNMRWTIFFWQLTLRQFSRPSLQTTYLAPLHMHSQILISQFTLLLSL